MTPEQIRLWRDDLVSQIDELAQKMISVQVACPHATKEILNWSTGEFRCMDCGAYRYE